MKKLLLVIVIASFGLGATAQTQFGIKFGLNQTKLRPFLDSTNDKADRKKNYDDYTSSLMGYNFGIAYNSGSDKAFRFQAELALSQRGVVYLNSDGEKVRADRYTYVDFKPLFNIGGGGDNWRAYFQFGPSVNFWLSKKSYDKDGKFIEGSDKWGTHREEEGSGYFDVRAELGVLVGAGFKYKLGPGWLLVNPRYEWGITPATIYDLGNDGFSEVNRTFSINLGYLYEF